MLKRIPVSPLLLLLYGLSPILPARAQEPPPVPPVPETPQAQPVSPAPQPPAASPRRGAARVAPAPPEATPDTTSVPILGDLPLIGQMFRVRVGPETLPMMPELGKETMTVLTLREIQHLGLTSADIKAALPLLKQWRDAEKTLHTKSKEALEAEIKALLAAGPGDTVPADSAPRLREAQSQYQETVGTIRKSLVTAVGDVKAQGIRRLLGQGGVTTVVAEPVAPRFFSRSDTAAEALGHTPLPRTPQRPAVTPYPSTPSESTFFAPAAARSQPVVSLSDLIDLLEKKLAAMRS